MWVFSQFFHSISELCINELHSDLQSWLYGADSWELSLAFWCSTWALDVDAPFMLVEGMYSLILKLRIFCVSIKSTFKISMFTSLISN